MSEYLNQLSAMKSLMRMAAPIHLLFGTPDAATMTERERTARDMYFALCDEWHRVYRVLYR